MNEIAINHRGALQLLDGKGYDLRGLTGALLTDAFISMTACLLLGWMLTCWRTHSSTSARLIEPLPENVD
jgi:hypothetical protein